MKLACCGLLLASACVAAFSSDALAAGKKPPQPMQPILPDEEPKPACDFSHLVGSSAATLDKSQFHGRPLRIIHEGDAVTQDYSPDRINIILDSNDVVIEVRCG